MKKTYMGIDVGSVSTKAVIIDSENRILAKNYLWTEADPVGAVKKLIKALEGQLDKDLYTVTAVGTTGSARKLTGVLTGAAVVKNEITAHAVGTLTLYPKVRTVIDIGGQDSKIIIIENGIVVDYAMNTLCAAGTGSFLSSQAQRLGIEVERFGDIAMQSASPARIAARCTVFAESDLVHKAQIGHKKEDIVAGLCRSVVNNYLNNVAKGKRVVPPVVFQGGVSKNRGVVRALEEAVGSRVIVDPDGHLTGALGAAVLARKSGREAAFSFETADADFTTGGVECGKCPNNCEIICVYRENTLIDSWGNRCEHGTVEK